MRSRRSFSTRDSGTAGRASIRAKNRAATRLTGVLQPPVVVTLQLLSNRHQRAPVLLMALGCVIAGLVVLVAVGAPRSVVVMVLAIVSGIVVLAAVSPFWKIRGHAAAVSSATAITVLMLGTAWLPPLVLIPAVGWSRMVLRAHTRAQVVAGSLFGAPGMAGLWWLLRGWLL